MSIHILFLLLILVTCISAMPSHLQSTRERPQLPSAQSQITVSPSGSIKAVKAATQILEELVAKESPDPTTAFSLFPTQANIKEREGAQRESTDPYKIVVPPTDLLTREESTALKPLDFADSNTLLSPQGTSELI